MSAANAVDYCYLNEIEAINCVVIAMNIFSFTTAAATAAVIMLVTN